VARRSPCQDKGLLHVSCCLFMYAGVRASMAKNTPLGCGSVTVVSCDVGSLSKQFSAPGSQLFPSALKPIHSKSNVCLTNTYAASAEARNFLSAFFLGSAR